MTAPATAKTTARRYPFSVRKVRSGYNGDVTHLVVKNPGGRRVSVHAHRTPESAWAAADDLNISDLVMPHAEDPRPYAERLAEAEVAYRAVRPVGHAVAIARPKARAAR